MALVRNSPSDLYERDYYAWVQDQVEALRERRIEDVDWKNVAEEIEDLGKSEKRALRSLLVRLVEHLLKIEHAPVKVLSENLRGWQVSVRSSPCSGEVARRESQPSAGAQANLYARLSRRPGPGSCVFETP